MAYMTKNKMIYASNKKTQGVGTGMEDFWILWIWGFCGDYHRFSVGVGWVWALKFNPNGSPAITAKT